MLVTLQDIIEKAEQGNYCVPAFNVYNIETVMGVIDAAEELNAPVIMQLYPRLVNEQVGYYIAPVVLAAAEKTADASAYLTETRIRQAYTLGTLPEKTAKSLIQ